MDLLAMNFLRQRLAFYWVAACRQNYRCYLLVCTATMFLLWGSVWIECACIPHACLQIQQGRHRRQFFQRCRRVL